MNIENPRSILILRYSALGDVVLATSILEPLQKRFPNAQIEWVTDARYAPLLENLPSLQAVHKIHRRGMQEIEALDFALRDRFDFAIDLQNKIRSRWIAQTAAKNRLVFRRRTLSETCKAILGRDEPLKNAHATELYARVLAPLGIHSVGRMQVATSLPVDAIVAGQFENLQKPRVAIAPAARWATKRWPTERFAKLADALAQKGAEIVLVGGPADEEILNDFKKQLRRPVGLDLSAVSLEYLAAALKQVQLLIACDSGPVHLAQAVGTRVIALFGPTSDVRWGPLPPNRSLSLHLDCSPCSNHGSDECPLAHHRCMKDLALEEVEKTAREFLCQ